MRCRLLLLLALCAHAGLAGAGEGDTFRPRATYSLGYDSNLFRLENDLDAFISLGETSIHGDTYQSLGVGFDLDWKQGRQRVVSRATVNKTRFNRYSQVDYDGQDFKLEWQWQLGNYWNGNLGATQTKSLGSFREVSGLVANTRTNDNLYFRADYRFHSRWLASFRANSASADYSAASQKPSNSEADTLGAALYYQGHTLDRIGVELRNSDGRFPDRTLPTTLATGYRERGIDFVANYTATGKSRLNARIGYLQRDNKNLAGRDFSGFEWRLDGTWFPTGKSLVGLSLYRDITNTEYAQSNHSLVDGVSLNWQWQMLPKTRMQASLTWENIDFDSIPSRKDKVLTAGVSASYEAWPGGEISAGLQRETRDTNVFLYDYTSNVLFLNANLLF